MLDVKNLAYVQDDFTLRANWRIERGQRVAILGPSGAGKSTLLSMIAGFLRPSSGEISWEGTALSHLPPGERPLSILFQDGNLFPHLNLRQNLGLGLSPNLKLSSEDMTRIEAALAEVGLPDKADRKPAALSGGEQSRAALARTLLRRRPLLLLDEPFAALGPAMKAQMLFLVAKMCATHGTTVLMVTHDPKDALALCPQTVLVADGVAAAPQSTSDLMAHPPEALRSYLGL